MVDDNNSASRSDLVPALFGLLTAKFEDAASHALEGQGPDADHLAIESEVSSLIAEAAILLQAVAALATDQDERGSVVE